MQETVNWSSELTLSRERWSGTAPVMSEEWKAQYIKAGRLWFWGVDVQENPGGPLKPDHAFSYVRLPSS